MKALRGASETWGPLLAFRRSAAASTVGSRSEPPLPFGTAAGVGCASLNANKEQAKVLADQLAALATGLDKAEDSVAGAPLTKPAK